MGIENNAFANKIGLPNFPLSKKKSARNIHMRFKEIQGKPGKPERTGSDRFRNRKPEKPEKPETGKTEPDQEVRFSYDSVKPWSTMEIYMPDAMSIVK